MSNESATSHTAESTHWYDRTGKPVYEVDSADGKRKVKPDLRHARKLGLLPGYTAVSKCLSKPGLENWKLRQMMLAALTLKRGQLESDEIFLARVMEDANAQAAERAAEGTQIHKAIEQSIRGETFDGRWLEHVKRVHAAIEKLPGPWLADFKTKETLEGKKDRELFFDEHIMQLAAYSEANLRPMGGIVCEETFALPAGYGGKIDARLGAGRYNLVSILIGVKDQEVRVRIWDDMERQRGKRLFFAALEVWKLRNYDSSF